MAADHRRDGADGAVPGQRRRLDLGKAGHPVAERRQDLDLLDRVDAELGLEVHLMAEHLGRVAGLLGDDRLDQAKERPAAGGSRSRHGHRHRRHGFGHDRCHGRRSGGRRRSGASESAGGRGVAADHRRDGADGAELGQRRRLDLGKAGHAVAERRQDLDLLDRVDAEFGFEVHVMAEHLGRVAGLLRDDGLDQAEEGVVAAGWRKRLHRQHLRRERRRVDEGRRRIPTAGAAGPGMAADHRGDGGDGAEAAPAPTARSRGGRACGRGAPRGSRPA